MTDPPPDGGVTGPPPDGGVTDPPPDGGVTDPPPDGGVTDPPPDGGVTDPPPDGGVTDPPPDGGVTDPPPDGGVTDPPPDGGVTDPPPDGGVTDPPPDGGVTDPPPDGGVTDPPVPLGAGFRVEPAAPVVGEVVTLTDTSTGPAHRVRWSIPGVTIADPTSPTVTVTFPRRGAWSVTLDIDADGVSPASTTQSVDVVDPPVPLGAGFRVEPAAPVVGEVVTLTDTSTGPAHRVRWSIPGVTIADPTSPTVTVTFPRRGAWSVTLDIDADGVSPASTTQSVDVVDPPVPLGAGFRVEPATPVVGEVVTLTDTSTGPAHRVRWSIPGVTIADPTSPTVTVTFPRRGAWSVTLDIDADGVAPASMTQPVEVQDAPVFGEPRLSAVHNVSVPESAASVSTGVSLAPGNAVHITATGSIWAGHLLIWANGPEGTGARGQAGATHCRLRASTACSLASTVGGPTSALTAPSGTQVGPPGSSSSGSTTTCRAAGTDPSPQGSRSARSAPRVSVVRRRSVRLLVAGNADSPGRRPFTGVGAPSVTSLDAADRRQRPS